MQEMSLEECQSLSDEKIYITENVPSNLRPLITATEFCLDREHLPTHVRIATGVRQTYYSPKTDTIQYGLRLIPAYICYVKHGKIYKVKEYRNLNPRLVWLCVIIHEVAHAVNWRDGHMVGHQQRFYEALREVWEKYAHQLVPILKELGP